MSKGKYFSQKHGKSFEVSIVKESKRYYWIEIFNSIQRKKKEHVTKI